ncbi:scarecrow-like protein 32 [Hibiscus syriacus]|uniref:scarecrow-like protein 32 n=1 Tax=Hibiscus syriacus TaxID=106335 RepID=UPI00192499CF|nr:scarecrow-like protein 32 [Hibiscus syriacus]
MKTQVRGNGASIYRQNPSLLNTPQDSITGALEGCLGSALENNDVTLAQQVMWVLNNVASSVGDTNQRLTLWFLMALICRASRVFPMAMDFNGGSMFQRRLMTLTELARYVDLIPWHRYGFCVSNSAILKAVQGCTKVLILDFSITHCMQWHTLLDALAKRPEGPLSLRITVRLEATSSFFAQHAARESRTPIDEFRQV